MFPASLRFFRTGHEFNSDATIIKAMFASGLQQLLSVALAESGDEQAGKGGVGLASALPEYLFADNASGRLLSVRVLRLLLS